MTEPEPFTVLVVDDDPDTRQNLRDILELDGFLVEEAGTAAEALDRSEWSRFVAVILHRQLPDATAEDVLPRLRQRAADLAVLVLTGYADVHAAIHAFRVGATDYALKPIDPNELRARLARIVEHCRAQAALRQSQTFTRSILDSLAAHIAVLDPDGTIVSVNAAWEAFAIEHITELPRFGVGVNYLEVCRRVVVRHAEEAAMVERGLREVLDGGAIASRSSTPATG